MSPDPVEVVRLDGSGKRELACQSRGQFQWPRYKAIGISLGLVAFVKVILKELMEEERRGLVSN